MQSGISAQQTDRSGMLLSDVINLAQALRHENLYINNEKAGFHQLQDNLATKSNVANELNWICAQHRQNLHNLILSRPDTEPKSTCQIANALENAHFVDAYKAAGLKYPQVLAYKNLFNYLYSNPRDLAQLLTIGDQLNGEEKSIAVSSDVIMTVTRAVATGLYGSMVNKRDTHTFLALLRHLIDLRIPNLENPRRMLKTNDCVFARFTHILFESLGSAKMYLTITLHDAIMKVLCDDEQTLELDPRKAADAGSSVDHEQRIRQHIQDTSNGLHRFLSKFIRNIVNNWGLFPNTLRWLVQYMCFQLKEANFQEQCIYEMVIDMVLTNFICPAIVSPDIYGITDCPVSENARNNLITVAQLLQFMALRKYNAYDIESSPENVKFGPLCARFDKDLLPNMLFKLMEPAIDKENPMSSLTATEYSRDFDELRRSNILITRSDLNVLVQFLRSVMASDDNILLSGECRRKLGDILRQLPSQMENGTEKIMAAEVVDRKSSFANLGKQTRNKLSKSLSQNHNEQKECNEEQKHLATVIVFPMPEIDHAAFELLTEDEVCQQSAAQNEIAANGGSGKSITNANASFQSQESFGAQTSLGEQSVLVRRQNLPVTEIDLLTEKQAKTEANSMHDDASIGNASDNLEAVSERSVASSLDENDDDQINDNLSDMVSANVSGRGSPNISGRDTPSSQITEGNEGRPTTLPVAKILNKARSDIDDKFCKFEIRKMMTGDESVSIMSDTWSTDVLASDSETLDASSDRDRNFSTPLIPTSVVLPGDSNFESLALGNIGASSSRSIQQRQQSVPCDISETQSESAWSIDVLASDSEKLAEIDTDDNQSIAARSDITDRGNDATVNVSARDSNNNHHLNGGGSNSNDHGLAIGNHEKHRVATHDSPKHVYRNASSKQNSFPNQPKQNNSSSRRSKQEDRSSFVASVRESNPSVLSTDMVFSKTSKRATSNYPLRLDSSDHNHNSSPNGDWKSGRGGESERPANRNRFFNLDQSPTAENWDNSQNPFIKTEFAKLSLEDNNDSRLQYSQESRESTKNDRIIRTNCHLTNPFAGDPVDVVQHRNVSLEQRNSVYDGRRNGMMQSALSTTSRQSRFEARSSRTTEPSVNYENHDIIRLHSEVVRTKQTASASGVNGDSHVTDALIQKTKSLQFLGLEGDEQVVHKVETKHRRTENVKFTGAIPKSISFDASAERTSPSRGELQADNQLMMFSQSDENARGVHGHQPHSSFFNKLKLGLKNRKSHKSTLRHTVLPLSGNEKGYNSNGSIKTEDLFAEVNGVGRCGLETSSHLNGVTVSHNLIDIGFGDAENYRETSEDILAKYRRKVSTSSEATTSDSTTGNGHSSSIKSKNSTDSDCRSHPGDLINSTDELFQFNSVKKKLRLILATSNINLSDFQLTATETPTSQYTSPLLIYLQIQMAHAMNLQDLQQIAYVQEAMRCLMMMSSIQRDNMICGMQTDLLIRQSYLKYLMRLRQNILSALKSVEKFSECLQADRDMLNRHLAACCVRIFMEKRESQIADLQQQFTTLTVGDEKIDLLEEFIGNLMNELEKSGMLPWQLADARISVERTLLQRLYRQVMFPNDDADILRDQMLRDHIKKLGKVISPDHAKLCIPQEFLCEAPWPFAQQQILQISAYKTAREKVRCVTRCITAIMNLLSMSNQMPSADDLTPVLIYVLIKANPPYLLSTIQYVNCFIGEKLSGEDRYLWTQFCAAVQFIKTMDYGLD